MGVIVVQLRTASVHHEARIVLAASLAKPRPVSLGICLRWTLFHLGCTIDDSSLIHSNRNPYYHNLDK